MSDSVIHALSGGAAGVLAMTCTYPLIFLSTRAAVETKNENKEGLLTVLQSTYEAVLDTIKREGLAGLYSGLPSSLWGVAVTNTVYYYFYERSRGLVQRGKALTTAESMLIGVIAGSATTIISNPIWVVQTSQAVQTMKQDVETSLEPPKMTKRLSILDTIKIILAKDGVGAFWRGIGPALVLVMNPVIQYTVFEQLKNRLVASRTAKMRAAGIAAGIAALSDWDFFFLGAFAKLVATSSTYPYIVVKSRLHAGHQRALRYKSSLDGLLTILKEEGVEGLYKGIASKLTQSVLTAAILFAMQRRIYEITKKAVSS